MNPVIIVNFKTYAEATGKRALQLAKIHDSVAKHAKSKATIMVAVQNADVFNISHNASVKVIAQHADPVGHGKNTGKQLPECIKDNGAWGVLINHSEDRAELNVIHETIKRCSEAGLKTVACAESISKAFEIAKMGPDYLAFEVPELIGTLKSISKLEPGSVKKFAEMVEKVNKGSKKKVTPLCGAGVADRNDVVSALRLGTQGVLVATAIVMAKDPKKSLEEFVGL